LSLFIFTKDNAITEAIILLPDYSGAISLLVAAATLIIGLGLVIESFQG